MTNDVSSCGFISAVVIAISAFFLIVFIPTISGVIVMIAIIGVQIVYILYRIDNKLVKP
jgi:hypothetical protein